VRGGLSSWYYVGKEQGRKNKNIRSRSKSSSKQQRQHRRVVFGKSEEREKEEETERKHNHEEPDRTRGQWGEQGRERMIHQVPKMDERERPPLFFFFYIFSSLPFCLRTPSLP